MNLRQFAMMYGLNAEELEERAAIIEIDGKEERINAELMACANAMKRHRPDVRYTEWASVWTKGRTERANNVRNGRLF